MSIILDPKLKDVVTGKGKKKSLFWHNNALGGKIKGYD